MKSMLELDISVNQPSHGGKACKPKYHESCETKDISIMNSTNFKNSLIGIRTPTFRLLFLLNLNLLIRWLSVRFFVFVD